MANKEGPSKPDQLQLVHAAWVQLRAFVNTILPQYAGILDNLAKKVRK